MLVKIKRYWIKTEDVSKVEWLFISILLTFCFFTMYYPDIMIILEEGLELLDCTFSGQFSDFYNYTPLHGNYRIVSVYGILPYIIFAVWGLPVWIINKIIPLDFFSVPVLLWFKLLLVVFLILTICAMIKIANELEFNKGYTRWMIYTFLTSFILVLPVFEIAQIDIICVAFITWGLFYYLRGNMKLFTLFFIVAIPLKLFAIFHQH